MLSMCSIAASIYLQFWLRVAPRLLADLYDSFALDFAVRQVLERLRYAVKPWISAENGGLNLVAVNERHQFCPDSVPLLGISTQSLPESLDILSISIAEHRE